MSDLVFNDGRILMPELFELGQKPYGDVVIDKEHPLARGLVNYAIVTNGTGKDLVGGGTVKMSTLGSTNLAIKATDKGLCFSSVVSDHIDYFAVDNPVTLTHNLAPEGFTVAALFRKNTDASDTTNQNRSVISGLNYRASYDAVDDPRTSLTKDNWASTRWPFPHTTHTMVQDEWVLSIVTHNSAGARVWWLNNDSAVDPGGFHGTDEQYSLARICNDALGISYASLVDVAFACAWDRSLTEEEVASFRANHYQFLIPA